MVKGVTFFLLVCLCLCFFLLLFYLTFPHFMLEVGMNIVLPLVQMLKIYCIHILKLSRMLNGMSYKLFSVDLNVGFDILLGFPISYEYKVIVVS